MSWWDDFTKPFNSAFNSNAFKAVFPVAAIANELTRQASKLGHIGGSQGLSPSNQYAVGAAGGSLLGGGGALFGGGSGGAGMTPYMPTSTPVMSQAGSTLGGGMGSSLNLGPSASMSGGTPATAVSSLQNFRRMPMSGGQQRQQQNPMQQYITMEQIYQKYPMLRPGYYRKM